MSQFSDKEIQAAFRAVDEDGSGEISASELRKCIDCLFPGKTDAEREQTTEVSK